LLLRKLIKLAKSIFARQFRVNQNQNKNQMGSIFVILWYKIQGKSIYC